MKRSSSSLSLRELQSIGIRSVDEAARRAGGVTLFGKVDGQIVSSEADPAGIAAADALGCLGRPEDAVAVRARFGLTSRRLTR